jgi:galactonate dehydratase
MKITHIDTWRTHPAPSLDGWAQIKQMEFLRLTSDDGNYGWGEASALDCRQEGIESIIHALGKRAATLDVPTPQAFRDLAKHIGNKHRGLDYSAATSAIEMALWDLHGQATGQPLYALLGGAKRRDIPVYANIWTATGANDAAQVEYTAQLVNDGYKAIKFYPLQHRTPEDGARLMAALRAQTGAGFPLMIDLVCPDDPETSLALATLVKPFEPYWFEEPCDGANLRTLAAIRAETGFRIVTGERHYGSQHFAEVFRARAADIVNPDIASVGGLLEMLEISDLAHASGAALSPHCGGSMSIGGSAMLHLCMADARMERAEIFPAHFAFEQQFATPGFEIVEGIARVNNSPGLGVQMNERALSRFAIQRTIVID